MIPQNQRIFKEFQKLSPRPNNFFLIYSSEISGGLSREFCFFGQPHGQILAAVIVLFFAEVGESSEKVG